VIWCDRLRHSLGLGTVPYRHGMVEALERQVDARVVIAHFEAEPVRVSGDKCSPARGESLLAAVGRVDRHPVAILAPAESVGGDNRTRQVARPRGRLLTHSVRPADATAAVVPDDEQALLPELVPVTVVQFDCPGYSDPLSGMRVVTRRRVAVRARR
jgi:hypothetical protein